MARRRQSKPIAGGNYFPRFLIAASNYLGANGFLLLVAIIFGHF
jgi:hypothetical protein